LALPAHRSPCVLPVRPSRRNATAARQPLPEPSCRSRLTEPIRSARPARGALDREAGRGSQRRNSRQLPVVGVIQPDDLGQHVRVAGVALGRGAVPIPITGHRHRIDREHPIGGGHQSLHPRTTVGLDPLPTWATASAGSRSTHSSGMCAAISACSRVIPSSPSGNRARASRRPVSSTSSTS